MCYFCPPVESGNGAHVNACIPSSSNLAFLVSEGMSLLSLLRADELEERRRGVEPFLRREPEIVGWDWVAGGIVQVRV